MRFCELSFAHLFRTDDPESFWVLVRQTHFSSSPVNMAPAQVFLRDVNGNISVVHATTVGDLRAAASAETRLVCAARDLTDADTSALLSEFGVCDGSTVSELVRLLGGGKKRKKKTYTKPKKAKHVHKNVKMASLKYYKVGDDGKIERLRRECPEEQCGAGVFMANHHDRYYCGKCGLTYVHEK